MRDQELTPPGADPDAVHTLELILASQAGDRAAAERLVEENTGLIRAVVRRFYGRGVEADDLFQLGSLGFLKAVSGFDPDFGTRFSTYAVPKIAGEIRRFLRDDGSVKVSRTLKERGLLIRRAGEELARRLGREPALSELAVETGLSPEEIAEAENAVSAVDSLQRPGNETGLTLEEVLTAGPMEDQVVERVDLNEALARLPDRERRVIGLRYFHDLTQEKTAAILSVSQVQISRIEKKALLLLRELLRA